MSIEEDWLVRRVRELTMALEGQDIVKTCSKCTSLCAGDLESCPHCGHPFGEEVDQEDATLLRSDLTKSGQPDMLEPPHGPGPTIVAATSAGQGGSLGEQEPPLETIDGEPAAYEDTNVETLRAELDRRGVFVPTSGVKKVDLIDKLRENDRTRDQDAEDHGSVTQQGV